MGINTVPESTMKTELSIQWQEHDLDGIMRYFANGFKMKRNQKLLKYEFVTDVGLRKVAFKLFIETRFPRH